MPVIDAIAGSPTANSYTTVAEADEYHASHPYAEVWEDADAEQKVKVLITATRLLDENVLWIGRPANTLQSLMWPRAYALSRTGISIQSGVIPVAVKWATAEYARLLIAAGVMPNTTNSDIPSGLESLKVGPISLSFDPKLTRPSLIDAVPASVLSIINFLVEGRANSMASIPLTRA